MNFGFGKKEYYIVSVRVADKLNKIKWFTSVLKATQWVDELEWAVGFDVEMSVSIDKRTVPVKIDECQLSFLPKGE
jgi:hypothetical protein